MNRYHPVVKELKRLIVSDVFRKNRYNLCDCIQRATVKCNNDQKLELYCRLMNEADTLNLWEWEHDLLDILGILDTMEDPNIKDEFMTQGEVNILHIKRGRNRK